MTGRARILSGEEISVEKEILAYNRSIIRLLLLCAAQRRAAVNRITQNIDEKHQILILIIKFK